MLGKVILKLRVHTNYISYMNMYTKLSKIPIHSFIHSSSVHLLVVISDMTQKVYHNWNHTANCQ